MPHRFGPFTADRASYRLARGDQPVDLTPKLLDLLFHLIGRPGVLLTKEELLDAVWPGANVTDNALAQAISELREALDDDAAAPTYIRTVSRRGYRFIAPVADSTERPASADAPAPVARTSLRTIAVLDFANVTGDADVEWLSAGIAETVSNDLAALDHFRVIDRWRVVQSARREGDAQMHSIGASLGANLVVTGSVQRSGPRVRVTARIVDLEQGEAVADAKVDGTLDEIFSLQDAIVRTFAEELHLTGTTKPGRHGIRETSSLDAYRAYMEGWLKLESLDTALVPAAIADFERAIASDATYAMAYTGLANAQFVAWEMTRVSATPNGRALQDGIAQARQAIHLDDHLAEAHATLAFLLVSSLAFAEARESARRAVELEPDNWRHRYRLGHASWGQSRVRAFEYVRDAYPQFAYAHFETAMVLVARGELEAAARIARAGVHEQDRQVQSGNRFPAIGFHWLLGSIEAAAGRHEAAILHFDRELHLFDPRRLYGPEYGANALTSRGHAELARGDAGRALASFRLAQTHVEGYVRAIAGEAAVLDHLGRPGDAGRAWQRARAVCEGLASTGRRGEALLASSAVSALRGEADAAVGGLTALFDGLPPCHLGWSLPVEPALTSLQQDARFLVLLDQLADRARS